MASQAHFVTTNDGVQLAYEKIGREGPVVLLIHGWTGSRHYFDLNIPTLAGSCQVYAYDQRFHGESGSPAWGFHIARLAADLRDLLDALDLQDVTAVGSSMGCAVLWSYFELFGSRRLAKCVFTDESPFVNVADDWQLGSPVCHNADMLSKLQSAMRLDFEGFVRGFVTSCTSLPINEQVRETLVSETLKARPDKLARLLADQVQQDWRQVLPCISVPCLNLVGRQSRVFPWQASQVVGQLIPACHTVFFEQAGHYLFLEEPAEFDKLVTAFTLRGLAAVKDTASV